MFQKKPHLQPTHNTQHNRALVLKIHQNRQLTTENQQSAFTNRWEMRAICGFVLNALVHHLTLTFGNNNKKEICQLLEGIVAALLWKIATNHWNWGITLAFCVKNMCQIAERNED